MTTKQEIFNLNAESVKRDMEEMIQKLERFTDQVTAGIRTPSDQDIHSAARRLRGVAERLNFELSKR